MRPQDLQNGGRPGPGDDRHLRWSQLTSAAWAQQTFSTPEAASAALIDLAKAGITRICRPHLRQGRGCDARHGRSRRRPEAGETLQRCRGRGELARDRDETTRLLQVGRNAYLFPVPIVKTGSGWAFDLEAGRIELENRRIGLNELSAIEACETYVAAQREYFKIDRDNDEVQQYASRFMSSPGRHDGLYWPPETRLIEAPSTDASARRS